MINPEFPEESSGRVSERTLREFAGLCLAASAGVLALSGYRHGGWPSVPGWTASAALVLVGLPGLLRPNAIRVPYVVAMGLTKPIGHVVGLVLLGVVYFGMMTPLALAFRLAGRDGLGRHRSGVETYWLERAPCKDVRLYLRQYQRQLADGAATRKDAAMSVSVPVSGAFTGVKHESA